MIGHKILYHRRHGMQHMNGVCQREWAFHGLEFIVNVP